MKIGDSVYFTDKNFCTFGKLKFIYKNEFSSEFDVAYLDTNNNYRTAMCLLSEIKLCKDS